MSKRKRHVEVVLYLEDGWTYEKIVLPYSMTRM